MPTDAVKTLLYAQTAAIYKSYTLNATEQQMEQCFVVMTVQITDLSGRGL